MSEGGLGPRVMSIRLGCMVATMVSHVRPLCTPHWVLPLTGGATVLCGGWQWLARSALRGFPCVVVRAVMIATYISWLQLTVKLCWPQVDC